MSSTYQVVKKAFKKPDASDACIAIGKIYAKNNSEYSLAQLKRVSKAKEPEFTDAIIRLTKEMKVLKYRPDIESLPDPIKKGTKIPIKYKMKDQYYNVLKKKYEDILE